MPRSSPLVALIALSVAAPCFAEVDLTRELAAWATPAKAGNPEIPGLFANRESGRVSLLAERVDAAADFPPGATRLSPSFCALELSLAEATRVGRDNPGFRFEWSRGRRLLMDRADGWIHASSARAASALSGASVVVGIVDSGVDVLHPDLRHSDGSTRVRWLIDFGRPPLGRHAELERRFGCNGANECAIYDAADIDALIRNDVSGDEPRDTVGHGTLVASLAAGNGASSDPARYVGVAPEAELVVARVTATGLAINDADIVNATRFVFERAEEMGQPAVVNLSLGSDFGAHDGSSALERALVSLIGESYPGRALVVAAGNSAGLFADPAHPTSLLGIHTERHLPRDTTLDVPLLTPGRASGSAGIDVWIETRPGDALSIAVAFDGAVVAGPVAPGRSQLVRASSYEIVVKNADGGSGLSAHPSASVLIGGNWPLNSGFSLRLSGHGTASLWLQGSGALDPSIGLGPMLEGGVKPGTINVPASHPELIAVGASLNRTDWIDVDGVSISMPQHGSLDPAPLDTTAFFSSAGPNSLGTMKPDLIAPGANLIGALSRLADPRGGSQGMFAPDARCPMGEQCYVVDDRYAVASGSSLAAPLVSGAIALLLQSDPSLTQSALRALLQAGARPLEGVIFSEQQVGIGALDIEGALAAQREETAPHSRVPASSGSWMASAASMLHPDQEWPVEFHAELRDDQGSIADGFDVRRLALDVRGASVVEPLLRIAPGLYRFALAAPAGSGGRRATATLRFDGGVLVERTLPIAVEPHVESNPVSARGGCAISIAPLPSHVSCWWTCAVVLALLRVRRSRGCARRNHSRSSITRPPTLK